MKAIFDSQSNAIVAIQSVKSDGKQSKNDAQGMLGVHPVIFTNKKSKELFGCDLMDGEKEENFPKINEPCFLQDTDGLNLDKKSELAKDPISERLKESLS